MNREKHKELYKNFLEKLKSAREDAGLNQNQVAQAISRPQSFVSKVEMGERRLDFVELQELASLYCKQISYFEED